MGDGNTGKGKREIGPVRLDLEDRSAKRAELIKVFQEMVAQPPGERPSKDVLIHLDQFSRDSVVPKFLLFVKSRLDGTWIYRSFKIPGAQYVVRDLRHVAVDKGATFETQASVASGSNKIYELKDAGLREVKSKTYQNYLADKLSLLQHESSIQERQDIGRKLSAFEIILIERFEKGKIIERPSLGGKPHFGEKSPSEWHEFFSKFTNRTVWQEAKLEDVRKFIYRGILDLKKGGENYVVLIGDLKFLNDTIAKFARLRILSELASVVLENAPGDDVSVDILKKIFGDTSFKYLSIISKHRDTITYHPREDTIGIFAKLRTEDDIAKKLGLKNVGSKRHYFGLTKKGSDESNEEEDRFVPLGFWERQKRAFWPKLPTIVISILLALLGIFGVWGLIKFIGRWIR